jgi:hypothetical protein
MSPSRSAEAGVTLAEVVFILENILCRNHRNHTNIPPPLRDAFTREATAVMSPGIV